MKYFLKKIEEKQYTKGYIEGTLECLKNIKNLLLKKAKTRR